MRYNYVSEPSTAGTMPVIDRNLFTGNEAVTESDWQAISLRDISNSSIAGFLERHGWEKKGAAAVGLKLQPDNTGVEGAKLVLLGNWDKKITLQAKKVFQ